MLSEMGENNSNNQFNISLDSFEGPIDLLLELAKKQKVDLSQVSILKLAELVNLFKIKIIIAKR